MEKTVHGGSSDDAITGEQLYALQMPGAFNKIPVGKLADGVVATLLTELDLELFDKMVATLLRLIISGSLIIVDELILPGEIIYVDYVEDRVIGYQLIKSITGNKVLKKWDRGSGTTTVTTYPGDSFSRKTTLPMLILRLEKLTPLADPISFRSDTVIIVENGLGILVPVRATIFRLEELMDVMQETTGEEALTWFITGFVGTISNLTSKTKQGGRFAPLPDGATIQNASDSSFSDRLFKEVQMLTPLFLEATHNFVIIPGESGIARRLSMMSYTNKVKQLQRLLAFIFDKYGQALTFDPNFFDLTDKGEPVVTS